MYMAEMRTVTTLFVKLDSYSPDKHKNLLSLQVFCFAITDHTQRSLVRIGDEAYGYDQLTGISRSARAR